MEEILKAIQAMQAQNQKTREAIQAQTQETPQNQALQAQNQETREAFQAQHQELKESLGLKFKCLDEISSVKEEMDSLKERLAAVETGHPRTPVFQQENNNSGRPLVKVPTFDGQSSWTFFKNQFDNVRDKASRLAAALRGPAVEVLQMIPEQIRLDFNALIDASRIDYKKKKESLQDLANDIRRLSSLAFPTCPSETQYFMAQQRLIDAIGDPETQKFARLSSPDNSKDKPERKRGRCWTCGAHYHISLTCPRKVKQRSDTDCWSGGQYGHMRKNCPENSETTTAPRKNHGRRKNNADTLSRRPCVQQSGHCARSEERFRVRQVTVQESDEVEEKNWTGQAIRKAQRERPSWEDVAPYSPETKSLLRLWNSLTLRDGVLYRKWESEDGKHGSWKLVLYRFHVPLALQKKLSSPKGGHFGIRKTLAKLREIFCWPKSRNDVENGAETGSTTRSRGKLKIYNVGAPFERMPAIHQWAGENLHFSSEKMKDRYNIKTSDKTFKEGEMVWLHNPQRKKGLSPKLQYQWEGPYKIIKCLNDVIFRIQKTSTSKPKVVHYYRTKLRDGLQASCFLKRSDCCLPPTPVYFLDSRRFYELLSPVLLLISLTVLQLSMIKIKITALDLFVVHMKPAYSLSLKPKMEE
ncbi:CPNE9 [Cordylochernes scorpioides]|uniref:CPNE9 n=1 Tax=Cordylochernes scorpioides TaxID=51811 RepID=A0ABY6K5N9_9ARAC|nr:CPNE9 [Cordylochernes scorpioides]